MLKILLAANDDTIAPEFEESLFGRGVSIDVVSDGVEAFSFLSACHYDWVIIEHRVSKISAYDLCRYVRSHYARTSLFLLDFGGCKVSQELVTAYGVDGWYTLREDLQAIATRILLLSRAQFSDGHAGDLVCGALSVNPATGMVRLGGETIELRPMEFVLLDFFMRNPQKTYSCEQLWKLVWRKTGPPTDTVRAHIAMLRRKIEPHGQQVYLKTVIGKGYRLEIVSGVRGNTAVAVL